MKRYVPLFALSALLTACSSQPTYQQVGVIQSNSQPTISLCSANLSNNSDVASMQQLGAHAIFQAEGLYIYMDSDLLFDQESATLSNNGERFVDVLADYVKDIPNAHILIVVHTDSVGNHRFNKKLSTQQAMQITGRLWEQAVPNKKLGQTIKYFGKGETKSLASNDNLQGLSINRRVNIQISTCEIKPEPKPIKPPKIYYK